MRLLLTLFFFTLGMNAEAQYKFMFLNSNPDKEILPDSIVEQLQKYHMANMDKLAKEGFLLVAGPFYTGGGIFIFDPSKGDLYENLLGDSAIMNNRFVLDVFDYEPVVGGVCAVGEGYDMVTYQFARFYPFSGSQVSEAPAISDAELEQLKRELDLVTYSRFGGRNGEILIYNQEEKSDLISELASVKGYACKLEEKKLYIAEGSFCEQ